MLGFQSADSRVLQHLHHAWQRSRTERINPGMADPFKPPGTGRGMDRLRSQTHSNETSLSSLSHQVIHATYIIPEAPDPNNFIFWGIIPETAQNTLCEVTPWPRTAAVTSSTLLEMPHLAYPKNKWQSFPQVGDNCHLTNNPPKSDLFPSSSFPDDKTPGYRKVALKALFCTSCYPVSSRFYYPNQYCHLILPISHLDLLTIANSTQPCAGCRAGEHRPQHHCCPHGAPHSPCLPYSINPCLLYFNKQLSIGQYVRCYTQI